MARRLPKDSLTVAIGARLRAARQSRGALQRELARAMGVTQGAVSNYEIGLSDIPVPALLMGIFALSARPLWARELDRTLILSFGSGSDAS